MWKINIVDEADGMFLYEGFRNTEQETQEAIKSYFSTPKLNLAGVKKMRIEKIYIDREKVYRDALEDIAHQHYDESEGNSFEIKVARTALGLPLDMPEYDNPKY